ncbi:hypothetical protein CRM82_17055 [Comamonas terrigena]|uniref:Secreted protein n=1 Tax=Comamonas terrigena TaxID=32013 RepID=A0A2A7UY18_COMTR|nr:hypothetical protein [Comamonas terrigena]PEH90071.1 hypothetical protein CRM82_17055 [Comamonas terrigena]
MIAPCISCLCVGNSWLACILLSTLAATAAPRITGCHLRHLGNQCLRNLFVRHRQPHKSARLQCLGVQRRDQKAFTALALSVVLEAPKGHDFNLIHGVCPL